LGPLFLVIIIIITITITIISSTFMTCLFPLSNFVSDFFYANHLLFFPTSSPNMSSSEVPAQLDCVR
jgi:hypothetical protein